MTKICKTNSIFYDRQVITGKIDYSAKVSFSNWKTLQIFFKQSSEILYLIQKHIYLSLDLIQIYNKMMKQKLTFYTLKHSYKIKQKL